MTDLNTIKESAIRYLVPIFFVVLWTGFVTIMDSRHEEKGRSTIAVTESDLRDVRREIRNVKKQLSIDPDAKYAPAREAELLELQDEEKELTEKLKILRTK